MMKRSFAVMVLVGCGAKPAEPLAVPARLTPNELQLSRPPHTGPVTSIETPSPTPPRHIGPGIAVPRPALTTTFDPPDVNEIGRWPMTVAEHPELDPHFDIASALAEPGITWTDLCARGAHHRHLATDQELVEYLDAWCSVIKADWSDAIAKLGPVRRAPNKHLAGALKLDVAAIVAAHGSAHDLEGFLRAGGFLDLDEVDLASAAYFEVGRLEDAAETNQLAETMDLAPSEKTMCTRVLRAIADTTGESRDLEIARLRLLANPPSNMPRVPRCHEQYDMLRCWKDHECRDYWGDQVPGATLWRVASLARIYANWDRMWSANDWIEVAKSLADTLPLRDRYTLMIPALDAVLRTSDCKVSPIADVIGLVKQELEDLAPRKSSGSTDPDRAREEHEHAAALAALDAGEARSIRSRLEATRAQTMSVAGLDGDGCTKALAKLQPPQP